MSSENYNNSEKTLVVGKNIIRFPHVSPDESLPLPLGQTGYLIRYKSGGATHERKEKLKEAGFEITNIIEGVDSKDDDMIVGRWQSILPVGKFQTADMIVCMPASAAAPM